jgi:hypothetical protein
MVHQITLAVAERLPVNTEARVEGGKLAPTRPFPGSCCSFPP